MNPHVSKMHSIFWGVSDGGTWEARFLKERGRKRLKREMHRLIREKWKLFGGDGGSSFIGGLAFKEMRTKSGPPLIPEKGKSHGTESGPFGSRGSCLAPPGAGRAPALAWGELPSPVPWGGAHRPEASPTSPSHSIANNRVSCWLCF